MGSLLLAWCVWPETVRGREEPADGPTYVGSDVCANCHEGEHQLWQGSSHYHTFEKVGPDNLPPDILAEGTVDHPPRKSKFRKADGRYLVETEGPDGKPTEYHLSHVVGRMRVRMFVATLPNGRM